MPRNDRAPMHILGLGSVGTVCAYLLTKSNFRVSYLARRPIPPPVVHESNGLSQQLTQLVNDSNGNTPITTLLIATKAHQTRAALNAYVERISPKTLTIFLQNGMGIIDSVRDILPSNRIVQGTTTMGAYRDGQSVRWVATGHILFAPTASTSLSNTEEEVLACLGEIVKWDTLEDRMYHKLGLNACINPVTAVFNLPNSCIAEIPSPAHQLSERLATEVKNVYAIARPQMDMSNLMETVLELAQDTGGNISSMLADVRAGRETEIDFINGYIVEMAGQAGIPVPENNRIIQKVKSLIQ